MPKRQEKKLPVQRKHKNVKEEPCQNAKTTDSSAKIPVQSENKKVKVSCHIAKTTDFSAELPVQRKHTNVKKGLVTMPRRQILL